MMASSCAFRLINNGSLDGVCDQTSTDSKPLVLSSPVISHRGLLGHNFIEMRMLSDQDFSENVILPHLNCLKTDKFKERQEHAHERLPRGYVPQHLFQTN